MTLNVPLVLRARDIFVSAALIFLCTSCALTSKNESVTFRYFTPESVTARASKALPDDATTRNFKLRLGRVISASHIRDKIVFRDAEHEIGFYEQLRWSERPEAYLRRATSRALFEENHIQQIVAGPGLTLEIELNVFEELRVPRHAARVEVAWILRNEDVVFVQRTLTVERVIASAPSNTEGSAVATAMADALAEGIHTMVVGVVAELGRSDAHTSE